MNKRSNGSLKISITVSALAAIGIVLGKFLAFNVTDFMRFSLENITIIFSGIVFGPLWGAAIGTVQDLVGCLAVGYAINPLITLGCATTGLVSGVIFRLTASLPLGLKIPASVGISHLFGSVLIKTLGLSIYYSLPFTATLLWRILNYVIVGAVEAILLFILLNSKQLLTQINKITSFSPRASFSSVKEAESYVKEVSGVFSKPGLERVEHLLRCVGNPERDIPMVHVAGTNGKGSTSAMLSSILRVSGLKVGSFNSPYLIEMRESIRIDNEPISSEELTSLLEELRLVADGMSDKPTEFELLTAAAYLEFRRAGVDVAIVECGMGGERDATNVIKKPLLSIITGVSFDHTSFLGSTLTEIATQKAGIIKEGCPVLFGSCEGEALAVIRQKAESLSAPLFLDGGSVTVKSMTLDGTVFDHPQLSDVRISLLGTHQPKNASLAISAANILKKSFSQITDESIRQGLANTVWQGRFELLGKDPVFVFDGAHNAEGVVSAVESIKAYFSQGVVCLSGVLGDKDYESIARSIFEISRHAVTVTPDSKRALSANDYAEVLSRHGVNAKHADSISDGVRSAIALGEQYSLPVVCLGSLYLYKDVKAEIDKIQ